LLGCTDSLEEENPAAVSTPEYSDRESETDTESDLDDWEVFVEHHVLAHDEALPEDLDVDDEEEEGEASYIPRTNVSRKKRQRIIADEDSSDDYEPDRKSSEEQITRVKPKRVIIEDISSGDSDEEDKLDQFESSEGGFDELYSEDEDYAGDEEPAVHSAPSWTGNIMQIIYTLKIFTIFFSDEAHLQLKDFQLEGKEWMKKMMMDADYRGCILADEMGLGKTGTNIYCSSY
jgi:SNF2 family DNA or RNA helicase